MLKGKVSIQKPSLILTISTLHPADLHIGPIQRSPRLWSGISICIICRNIYNIEWNGGCACLLATPANLCVNFDLGSLGCTCRMVCVKLFSNRLFTLQKRKNNTTIDSSLRNFFIAVWIFGHTRTHNYTPRPRGPLILFALALSHPRALFGEVPFSGQQTDLAEIAHLESIFSTEHTRVICAVGFAIPAQDESFLLIMPAMFIILTRFTCRRRAPAGFTNFLFLEHNGLCLNAS